VAKDLSINLPIKYNFKIAETELRNWIRKMQGVSNINLNLNMAKVAKSINNVNNSVNSSAVIYDKYGNVLSDVSKKVQKTNTQTQKTVKPIKDVDNAIKDTTKSVDIFGQSLLSSASKFTQWYLLGGAIVGVINSIKTGVDSIIQLDSSLTELRKVSDLTSKELDDFTDSAYNAGKQIGRTGKDVIDASAEFLRAGWNIADSAKLSEQALLLTNVADGLDNTAESAGYLIAVMKGYNLVAEDSVHIVNLLNEVSNNYAVNTVKLAEGLQRASGTLSQTGTSLEELSGILTGGYEVLRNMEKVSTGLITISSRLRGISENGEEIDGLMPKLQRSFKEFAGIDIQTKNGELRSTYDILQDLARVWSTLNDEERAKIGELTSGIRQAPVLNAILMNWQSVEGAIESATNSANSALIENEKYLDSIAGKISLLTSSIQLFWKNAINSDFIKNFIDRLTSFVEFLDILINKTNYLQIAMAGLSSVLAIKLVTSLQAVNFQITAMTGGLNILLALLATATIGYTAYASSIQSTNSKIEDFNKNTETSLRKMQTQKEKTVELDRELENLKNEYGENSVAQNDLLDVQNKLIDINPSIISSINDQELAYGNLKNAIIETMNKQKENLELFIQTEKSKGKFNIQNLESQRKKLQEEIDYYNEVLNRGYSKAFRINGKEYGMRMDLNDADREKYVNKLSEKLAEQAIVNSQLRETKEVLAFLEKKPDSPYTPIDSNRTGTRPSDVISSTTSTGLGSSDAGNPYQSRLEQFFNTLQLLSEKEAELISIQKQRVLATEQERLPLINKEIELQNDLIKLNEDLLTQQKDARQGIADQLGAYSNVVKVSDDLETLSVNTDTYNKLTDKQKENLDELISSFTNLNKSIISSENSIYDAEIAIKNLNNEVQKINEDWEKKVNELADKVIEIYKNVYKEQKEAKLNALDDEINAEERRHQRVVDNLQDELDEYEDYINKKQKLLDREANKEDYNEQLSDLQQERAEIQDEINVLSLDNSIEARARLFELNKQLTEKEEEIERLKTDRSRELRRDNLQDQLDEYREDIEAKQESEDKKYQKTKNRLEQERQSIITHYDNLINNERMYTTIREEIINGHLENVLSDFDGFVNGVDSKLQNVSQSIKNNLIDSIRSVKTELNSLSSYASFNTGKYSYKDSYGNTRNTNANTGGDLYYSDGRDAELIEKQREMLKDLGYYHGGGEVGGVSFNSKTEEIAKLLKGELVLNEKQLLNVPTSISNIIKSIIPKQPVLAGANGDIYNMNFVFDNFRGTRRDQENVFTFISNKMKSVGKK